MRALGCSDAICTASCGGCKSNFSFSKLKFCFPHSALLVNWKREIAKCGLSASGRPPIRCSIICLTEDGCEGSSVTGNSSVVVESNESGGSHLGTGYIDGHCFNGELSVDASSRSAVWKKLADSNSETKFHFLEETDVGVLSRRIISLSRSNRLRSAMEMYSSMEKAHLLLTSHACNSLISCILRNGSVDDALMVFESMRMRGVVSSHSYSLLLKAVLTTRGGDCALSMFLDFEAKGECKGGFDAVAYNTVLMICGKVRNWREAERVWCNLKENGLQGTRVTYCLLISTFVQCGQTDLALRAYYEMMQNGFEVDEDNMKAIIATCTSDGRWDIAVDILEEMLRKGSKPNILLFNAVINCLGKAGEVDRAFEIFDVMRSSYHAPDTYTWHALLSALYRGGQYASCLRLFSTISKNCSSNMTFHLFNTALLSCQKLGLWDHSLQILWQMESSQVQVPASSYNIVLGACETARKPMEALQVYQHMIHRNCQPDSFTFLTLIRVCIWGSLWTEIEFLLQHVEPNAALYNTLVQGFYLRGKIKLAKKFYKKMHDSGLEADGKTRALMLHHMPKRPIRRHRYTEQSCKY